MWLPLALFTAFTNSLINPVNKYQVKAINPIVLLLINQCFTIFFMIILVIFLGGVPHVTPKFFLLMTCSSILDVIAFSFGYYAVKHSDISVLAPLSSFTPVFALFFGAIFLFEIPAFMKLLGVLTIVIGVYLLNISEIKGGLLKPIHKLISDKGVRLYAVQGLIFGLTPVFQKQAIFEITPSMPFFASFVGNSLVTFYLLIYILIIKKAKFSGIPHSKSLWLFVMFGLFNTFGQYAGYEVFSKTYIGYATAIFSLSSLFAIFIGGLFFKETNIKERLLGAVVMIIGVILIAL